MNITINAFLQPRMMQNDYQRHRKHFSTENESFSEQGMFKQSINKTTTSNSERIQQPMAQDSIFEQFRFKQLIEKATRSNLKEPQQPMAQDSISNQSIDIQITPDNKDWNNRVFNVDHNYKISIYAPGQEVQTMEINKSPLGAENFAVAFQKKVPVGSLTEVSETSHGGTTVIKAREVELNQIQMNLGSVNPSPPKAPPGEFSSFMTLFVPPGGVLKVDDGEGHTYIYDDAKKTDINIVG